MKKLFQKHKIKLVSLAVVFAALGYIGQGTLSKKNNFEFKSASGAESASPTPQESSFPAPSAVQNDGPLGPMTGMPCDNPARRPIAVMLAIDRETRPLSGIGEADMVFEMPVITNGATRLMAVYQCSLPKEIGSVRSARHDFIDLALGVDAVFAHWGGSHFALDDLKTGIADDLDALANRYDAFYRKRGVPMPHNGFTSSEGLLNAVQKLGYRMESKFEGYSHYSSGDTQLVSGVKSGKLAVGYPGELRVEYQYDSAANSYLRWRGGIKETDRNNGNQVSVKNIAVLYAASRQIEGDYNDVKIDGEGKAEFYANGGKIEGSWKKAASPRSSKLYFLDNSGNEIKFTPGNIWVEVVQTDQKVEWIVQ